MNAKKAFSLLEVLVAVAALSLMTIVGMRSLTLFLEQLVHLQSREQELSEIRNLGQRLQRMIDQRQDHRFLSEPGIDLKGDALAEGFLLRDVVVRTWETDCGRVLWELKSDGMTWVETRQFSENGDPDPVARSLNYKGRILLHAPGNSVEGNSTIVQWTFPDAASGLAQDGFAICRLW